MQYILTGEQMKRADRYTIETIGIPSMVLMERAALGVLDVLEAEGADLSHVLIICGSGNNGGDGYALARLLHLKGCPVEVCFIGNEEKRSPENKKQKEICEFYRIPTLMRPVTDDYTLIVDAIFGIGLTRKITGAYDNMITLLNQMHGMKVALDVPSGIHDTSGQMMGVAFRADLTVTIAYIKRGLLFGEGREHAGTVRVADIGIPLQAFSAETSLVYTYDKEDLFARYPKRREESHKGTYGRVLLVAGSRGMSGAAYLSAKAAYMAGAGLVQIYTSEDNRVILQQLLPEAIITTYEEYDAAVLKKLIQWADIIAAGSGLSLTETASRMVKTILQHAQVPCVLDADALNIISEHKEWLLEAAQPLILTPHMKEMARLSGCTVEQIKKDRFECATAFAKEYALVLVLKDARTLAVNKDEDVFLNTTGNCAMAKGGSGDVLTGILAGILAQKMTPYEAATLGVCLHGLAGDRARDKKGRYSVLAEDIIDGIGEVLHENV